jgi:arginine deiminase
MDRGIKVFSEIGRLDAVIIHSPGIEVERMTPNTIKQALFSDILSKKIAAKEHRQISGVLKKVSKVYHLKELLYDVFALSESPILTFRKLVAQEKAFSESQLQKYTTTELVDFLIEGKWENDEAYTSFELTPLYNFYFMRDASVSIGDQVMVGEMAKPVRNRESLIMNLIFKNHPEFLSERINFESGESIRIEGGDVLIARDDVLLIGNGSRTSEEAILQLAKKLTGTSFKHILVQELPEEPDSFIHLDMVFTFLDTNLCMVYEPVFRNMDLRTKYIRVDSNPQLEFRDNFFCALEELGFNPEYIQCGGNNRWYQDREQWHSGANFFAFAPGKVIGYERNRNTIQSLKKAGFEVLKAEEVISGEKHPDDYQRCVVTLESAELVRGGGGARCMTMPVRRQDVSWQ